MFLQASLDIPNISTWNEVDFSRMMVSYFLIYLDGNESLELN